MTVLERLPYQSNNIGSEKAWCGKGLKMGESSHAGGWETGELGPRFYFKPVRQNTFVRLPSLTVHQRGTDEKTHFEGDGSFKPWLVFLVWYIKCCELPTLFVTVEVSWTDWKDLDFCFSSDCAELQQREPVTAAHVHELVLEARLGKRVYSAGLLPGSPRLPQPQTRGMEDINRL